MDASVPAGAALLLDFISEPESGGSYLTLYGHHERGLTTPITQMTVDALLTAQIGWGAQWGSSAAGRYQLVQPTLAGLRTQLGLTGKELFAPDLQDRLGYALLLRRGYADFRSGKIDRPTFARHLAQEWASMPVLVATQGAHRMLTPGQSYYAGDGLNKALVTPAAFDAVLTRAHAAKS